MSELTVTLQIDTREVDAQIEELRLLLERLPDGVKSEIGDDILRSLDSGGLDVVAAEDATAVGAGAYRFVARWLGLNELIAAARRAADGEVDVFHGNPSQSGFDGRGDCDSTAGRDSHLFSNKPST